MRKQNLVLIPGFQTNSIILKELQDYMGEYYNVHFIDFPGFNINLPSFPEVSLQQFVKFTQSELERLNLDSYILGGISFGFIVVGELKLDSRCRGILAIEPYLGIKSIGVSKQKLAMLQMIGNFVNKYKYYDLAFAIGNNRAVELLLTGGKDHRGKKIIQTTDPRTYFETVKILLNTNSCKKYHKHIPHVILMNPRDKTLNYEYVVDTIRENIERFEVINMDMEHFPTDLSHKYFANKLPARMFQEINKFIVKHE